MLIIIRGLPGSGKSTLAEHLEASFNSTNGEVARVFEADQYFQTLEGYKFDGTKLREAHDDCQRRAFDWMKLGNIAIVSNTSTQRWEYQPYISMAKMLNMPVQVIEVHGDFGNIHGVPPDKIESMRNRWEAHI
jgi:tRNA uridine 5-carbamoylmethylation protein Kti12